MQGFRFVQRNPFLNLRFDCFSCRDFQESQLKEIELKGVTSLGLRAVLDFVYTSRLALNSNHIHDILQTASHLQFNQVIDYCCQFLK